MIEVIILAAGKGTRMNDVLPKALVNVKNRPMISYIIDTVSKAGIKSPIIVVGENESLLRKELGDGYKYVRQQKQLGTGHAVKIALSALDKKTEKVIVLYCDHPLITKETITKLSAHNTKSVLTMAVAEAQNFYEWRNALYSFGRITRNEKREITAIVEKKDATPEQLKLDEVNPSYFCFDREWLEKAIHIITNNNAQKEYYLTDLVGQAVKENKEIIDIVISPEEALGANTKEEIVVIEGFL